MRCVFNKDMRECAKRTNNNKFCSKVVKTLKIDPEGTCGPIGLKSVSFFWCCSWHQNGIKKFVDKCILKSDILIVEKVVIEGRISCLRILGSALSYFLSSYLTPGKRIQKTTCWILVFILRYSTCQFTIEVL